MYILNLLHVIVVNDWQKGCPTGLTSFQVITWLYKSKHGSIQFKFLGYTKIYNKSTIETTSNFTANPDFLVQLKEYLNTINNTLSVQHSIDEYNRESQIIFKQQENIFSSLKEKVSETKESWEKYKQKEEIKNNVKPQYWEFEKDE